MTFGGVVTGLKVVKAQNGTKRQETTLATSFNKSDDAF